MILMIRSILKYIWILHAERRKNNINELESKFEGMDISDVNIFLFENIKILKNDIELSKSDADKTKLYKLRRELSILYQIEKIEMNKNELNKIKNNEENGN